MLQAPLCSMPLQCLVMARATALMRASKNVRNKTNTAKNRSNHCRSSRACVRRRWRRLRGAAEHVANRWYNDRQRKACNRERRRAQRASLASMCLLSRRQEVRILAAEKRARGCWARVGQRAHEPDRAAPHDDGLPLNHGGCGG